MLQGNACWCAAAPAAQVPITPDLVYSFGPQAQHLYSLLAGTFYAPVVNWVFSTPGDPYYAWDALTAACMMQPSLCKVGTGSQDTYSAVGRMQCMHACMHAKQQLLHGALACPHASGQGSVEVPHCRRLWMTFDIKGCLVRGGD